MTDYLSLSSYRERFWKIRVVGTELELTINLMTFDQSSKPSTLTSVSLNKCQALRISLRVDLTRAMVM